MKKSTIMLVAAIIGLVLLFQFAGIGETVRSGDEVLITAQFTSDPITQGTQYMIHGGQWYNYSYYSYLAMVFLGDGGKSYYLCVITNLGNPYPERNDFGNYTATSVYCAKDSAEPSHLLHTLFKYTEDVPGPPPVTTASYTVTINDAVTNSPVPGATVTLNSLTGTTDIDGSYTFQDLELGKYTFTARADGYVTITESKLLQMAVAYYDLYTMPLLVEGPGVIPPVEGGGGSGDDSTPPGDSGVDNATEASDLGGIQIIMLCAGVGVVFLLLATGVIQNPVFPKKWAIIIGAGLLAIAFLLYSGVL